MVRRVGFQAHDHEVHEQHEHADRAVATQAAVSQPELSAMGGSSRNNSSGRPTRPEKLAERVARYRKEGDSAVEPGSRRPKSSPTS